MSLDIRPLIRRAAAVAVGLALSATPALAQWGNWDVIFPEYTFGPEQAPTSGAALFAPIAVTDPGDPDAGIPMTVSAAGTEVFEFLVNRTPGQGYFVGFRWAVRATQFGPGTFKAWWGNTQIVSFTGENGSGDWTTYFDPGAGTSTRLRFEHSMAQPSCTGSSCDEWQSVAEIDDLSVVAGTPVLATPEPSTYALTAGGLLALGVMARRRRGTA